MRLLTLLLLFFSIGLQANSYSVFTPIDTTREAMDWFTTTETIDYSPVCGSDDKSYLNSEEALFYGVKSWSEGSCVNMAQLSYRLSVNDLKYADVPSFDFTNIIFEVYKNQNNNLVFEKKNGADTDSRAVAKAWIDFNKNSVFEDDELVIDTESKRAQSDSSFDVPSYLETHFMTSIRVLYSPKKKNNSMDLIEEYTVTVAD